MLILDFRFSLREFRDQISQLSEWMWIFCCWLRVRVLLGSDRKDEGDANIFVRYYRGVFIVYYFVELLGMTFNNWSTLGTRE